MNKYKLFADKLINMLLPHSQRGRRHILWLQSLVSPLQTVNDTFQDFVIEKRIEANMTSRVFHFEWYLNHKFRQYLVNQEETIQIDHYVDLGVPYYNDGETGETYNVIYSSSYDWSAEDIDEQPIPLYWGYEGLNSIGASFSVTIPNITISTEIFDVMLRAEIDRYRLAGRTYVIEHTN